MPAIQYAYEEGNREKFLVENLENMHDLFASKKRVAQELTCGSCEEAVIARRGSGKKHFAHRKGCGESCDWISEKLRTKGYVASCIHQGKQKGKVHQAIQDEFFQALFISGYDVKSPDKYFKLYEGQKPGRYPDIRVTLYNRDIIFEIQIRPIQVPDIIERTTYYDHPRTKLFWVLNEIDFDNLRSFQWDAIAAQGGIAYSVDPVTRKFTEEKNVLHLRAAYLIFETDKYGCIKLKWNDVIETFSELAEKPKLMERQELAKVSVENCHKFNLSEFKPKISTIEYQPQNFATLDQQNGFRTFCEELIRLSKADQYVDYRVKLKNGLNRIAELLGEDQHSVIKLTNDEQFFKAVCTFMSFNEGQIKYFNFSNFKELLNNFISNDVYHRWLPLLIPTILQTSDFPNGFSEHLKRARDFTDDDPDYTSLTSKVITFFFPEILKTSI